MQAKQSKSSKTEGDTKTAEVSQRLETRAGTVTRLPAWTHTWGNQPPSNLTISEPGDIHEQEADRVADQVMHMPNPSAIIQRRCACGGIAGLTGEREECAEKRMELQRKSSDTMSGSAAPVIANSVLSGKGYTQLQRQSASQQSTLVNNPPSGSVYSSLVPALLATLRRSFDERIQNSPNSMKNLDNSFWGGKPANLWDALDRLPVADINTLVEVFERAGGAWSYIYSIQNIWTGSSKGFMFTCKDSVGLANYLTGNSSFCRDSSTGQSEHQTPNTKDCWREVIKGGFGLHFCLDRARNLVGNELHIDLHQTVNKKDADGSCNYSVVSSTWIRHIWDVHMNYEKSIFEHFQDSQFDVQRLRSEFHVSSDTDLVTAETRLNALDPFMRQQAVRGLQGEQQAKTEKGKELEEIDRLIRSVFVRVVPKPSMMGPKF